MLLASTVYLLICLLLITVALLEQGQSGGMGILSGSSNTLLGSSKASFLSKVVTFLSIVFVVGALLLSILSSGDETLLQNFSPPPEATPPAPPGGEQIVPLDSPSEAPPTSNFPPAAQ